MSPNEIAAREIAARALEAVRDPVMQAWTRVTREALARDLLVRWRAPYDSARLAQLPLEAVRAEAKAMMHDLTLLASLEDVIRAQSRPATILAGALGGAAVGGALHGAVDGAWPGVVLGVGGALASFVDPLGSPAGRGVAEGMVATLIYNTTRSATLPFRTIEGVR